VDVFPNPKLLTDIHTVKGSLKIHTQAGATTTKMRGNLRGYGEVWCCKDGIANILSLSNIKKKHRVTFDSCEGNQFVVHRSDGTARTFNESKRGLCYLDVVKSVQEEMDAVFINTVAENKSKYTETDYSKALLARKAQRRVGHPSLKTFLRIVDGKRFKNCPLQREDLMAAEDIWGANMDGLKGKTVRQASDQVQVRLIPIPPIIMERCRWVTLGVDIMKVNQIPFLVIISQAIKFGTAELLTNQKSTTIYKDVKRVCDLCRGCGFRVKVTLMDGQFECLRGDLAGIGVNLNSTAREEHVPIAEQRIRTLKERTRSTHHTLPFKKMPAQVIAQMVHHSNFWLNVFPPKDGISGDLCPREIITGCEIDFNKHCQLEFGEYTQVHEEHDNSMVARTTGALAMRPTGNAQSSYCFYSLNTGRLLNRNRWTALPMPAEVIQRVHVLARNSATGLTFTDNQNQVYEDDDDDYQPDGDIADDDDLDASIAGVDDEELNDLQAEVQHPPTDDEQDDDEDKDPAPLEQREDSDNESENESEDEQEPNGNQEENEELEPDTDPEENDNPAAEPTDKVLRALNKLKINDKTPEIIHERARSQSRQGANMTIHRPSDHYLALPYLEAVAMTQYNMKRGIKEFGQDGVEAVTSELKQLHVRKTVKPVIAKELTHKQKRASLQCLMFLKQKKCGRIKGRGCADGRKQRATTNKEDASAPTAATESAMLSCAIDAMEGRDVATADIPGVFMHEDMDETVHIRLEGTMAELLTKIDPPLYRKCACTENSKTALCVELVKALHGTLRAALLFWRALSNQLKEWGFEINPYDWCVANKTVNRKQCTMLWHVDDLKILHIDPEVVTDMLDKRNATHGKEAPITVQRGKTHEYLGMTIDYSVAGKVKMLMKDYIEDMLKDLLDEFAGVAATPAGSHLFEVNSDNPVMLNEENATFLHHYVAKSLFLCKRARPDIQPTVAFLCTRVKGPDTDDYKKLKRMMQHLRDTKDLEHTTEINNIHVIKWWIDGSYAVHPDMRSHTGGMMSMGKGAIYGSSTRQKMNTRSSTEAELVSVDDLMGQALWIRCFLEAQGYKVNDNIVHQDNKSAILLEKNGRGSAGKGSRHLNVRCFFVTDQITKEELRVEHCPTEEMTGNFFTKPLQGSLFRKFRQRIMNLPTIHKDAID